MAKRTTTELRSEAAHADDAGYSPFGDTVRECADEIDRLTAQLTAERARAREHGFLEGVRHVVHCNEANGLEVEQTTTPDGSEMLFLRPPTGQVQLADATVREAVQWYENPQNAAAPKQVDVPVGHYAIIVPIARKSKTQDHTPEPPQPTEREEGTR